MRIYYCLFLICATELHAQKYGNIWYFGNKAGIDFNSCTPILLNDGKIPASEGCATICDTSGQLLFYTNSDTVWNRQHLAMPNGKLVQASGTLSQVIIIPKPMSQNIFYIITTQIQGQPPLTLQYHIVDMFLNGGLGDVISKNNVLTTATITEQVAATYHSNGTDIWIVAHEYGNDKFLCYYVDSSDINPSPVISNIGPAIIPISSGMNARGEIKFSPNGKKLAINNNGIGNDPNSDYLCLFDFDNGSGIVSYPINLPYERGGFGLSFSPDNSKLYAATWKAFNFSSSDSNKIFQFEISSNDSDTIVNSKAILYSTPVSNSTPFGSLKLTPNGKIYVAVANTNYVGIINFPNQIGVSCNYVHNGFYLGSKILGIGLDNYIEYQTYCSDVGINEIINTTATINAYPNPTANTTRVDYTLPQGINEGEIIFYTLQGVEVKRYKVDDTFNTLLLDNTMLPAGVYFYQLQTNKGAVGSKKMVMVSR